jgi:hypothetical protein
VNNDVVGVLGTINFSVDLITVQRHVLGKDLSGQTSP